MDLYPIILYYPYTMRRARCRWSVRCRSSSCRWPQKRSHWFQKSFPHSPLRAGATALPTPRAHWPSVFFLILSDAFQSVSLVSRRSRLPWDCIHVIQDLWDAAGAFRRRSCKWVDGEDNSVAHGLCQLGMKPLWLGLYIFGKNGEEEEIKGGPCTVVSTRGIMHFMLRKPILYIENTCFYRANGNYLKIFGVLLVFNN